MGRETDLTIRRSERTDVAYFGLICIRDDAAAQVSIPPALGAGDGWFSIDIIDMSTQGLGAMSEIFIPRRAAASIRLFNSTDIGEPICEVNAVVQRIIMTDRRPAYLLGLAFQDPDPQVLSTISTLTAAFAS
jgi:hypothetical protein